MPHSYKIIPALGFDFLTPFYDFFSNVFGFGNSLRSRIIKIVKVKDGDKILDIGCGTGSLAISLKKLYPNAQISGVDPDPKILSIARKKTRGQDLDIKFIHSYAEKLLFPKNSFDTVLSSLTFHHLPRQAKLAAAKEIRRVLKPGGQFYILDFLKVKNGLGRFLRLFEEWEYTKSNNELVSIFKKEDFKLSRQKNSLPWGLGILSGRKL